MTTAGTLAATSLLLTALAVRFALGESGGVIPLTMIAIGTIAGTCLGSWLAQPAVTRFISGRR